MSRHAALAGGGFYLLYFSALGAYGPFLNLYLREQGLSGAAIGALSAIPPAVMLGAQLFWGALSDRSGRRQVLLAVLCGAAALCFSLVGRAPGALAFGLAYAAFAFFSSPVAPVADSIVLEALGDREGYGRARLWGSVGFAAAAVVTGRVLEAWGTRTQFPVAAGLLAAAGAMALALPAAGGPLAPRVVEGPRTLVRDPGFRLFLLAAFLLFFAVSGAGAFLGIHLESLGASRSLTGAAFALAAASEAPFFLFAGRFLTRFGPGPVLAAAMGCYTLRWLLLALLRDPLAAVAVQVLNGPSFGLLWPAAVSLVHRQAPPGLRATGQTLFWAVAVGLATVTGSPVLGRAADLWGLAWLYGICALLSCAATWTALRLPTVARPVSPAGCLPSRGGLH